MILKLVSLIGISFLFCSFAVAAKPNTKTAVFAGGCFWCMEHPFEKVPGVIDVTSGYTGGEEPTPDYESVASGSTGHAEAVRVTYDPEVVSYEAILDVYFRQIDPTDSGGQFVDRGPQYRPEIFYGDNDQKKAADEKIAQLNRSGKFGKQIIVPVTQAGAFFNAEDYHQDFYKKSAERYNKYRKFSGRDQYINRIWAKDELEAHNSGGEKKYTKPSDEELKKRLTSLQFDVVRGDSTERPFKNIYWDNKKDGIYVDIASGEPLFSSRDKYVSGTGWPSFTKPLVAEHIVTREDRGLFTRRTEVRSKYGDSHLGHVFNDGPAPTGLRYCLNSAALRFVPVEDLKKEGLEEFFSSFEVTK